NNLGDDETLISVGALDFGQKVIDAAAGLSHTCVLLEDGNIKCFGDNSKGQLGHGDTNNLGDNETIDLIPIVPLGQSAVKLYSGTRYNCALLQNQEVKCWGENNYGQLGYGHTQNLGDDELLSTYGSVPLGGLAISLDISTISYHSCAVLKSSGGLKCWGLNNKGQLGYGHTNNLGDDELPSSYGNVSFGNKILQVATGYIHTCALGENQQVRCWGANNVGQTGFGSNETIGDNEAADSAPFLTFASSGAKMVATGNAHSCIIGLDASVYCFGLGTLGQTGLGHTNTIGVAQAPTNLNTKVGITDALTQVSTGLNHTCVLTKKEGKVICFGQNTTGQLGLGHTNHIGDDEVPWEYLSILLPK
ncbi:MAG: RTX toxin, partial [Halobacteriovoraceae bacterium]|nr:RTX toxin [Halobacteriovoraceae bacterium]